jgi:hypothetical protein
MSNILPQFRLYFQEANALAYQNEIASQKSFIAFVPVFGELCLHGPNSGRNINGRAGPATREAADDVTKLLFFVTDATD